MLTMLSLPSLPQAVKNAYGERSLKGALAYKALDAALAEAFDAMSSGAGRRLTSQLIAGPALTEKLAVGGRRLQGTVVEQYDSCHMGAFFSVTSSHVIRPAAVCLFFSFVGFNLM